MHGPSQTVLFQCPECHKPPSQLGCGRCGGSRVAALTATGAECSCGNHIMRVKCRSCGGVAMREHFFLGRELEQKQEDEAMSEQGLLVFFKCPKCKSDHRHLRCINCSKEREFTLTDNAALCSCMIPTEQVECPQCKAIVVRKFFFQHGSLEEEKAAQANHRISLLMGCVFLIFLGFGVMYFVGGGEKPKSKKKPQKIVYRSTDRPYVPPKPKHEDLSNTLMGRMLAYAPHIKLIKKLVPELGKNCTRLRRKRWESWSKVYYLQLGTAMNLAKKLKQEFGEPQGPDEKIPFGIHSTYGWMAKVWVECNNKRRRAPNKLQDASSALLSLVSILGTVHNRAGEAAQKLPSPKTCKDTAGDLEFLGIMYGVVTKRTYKPTIENCSKVMDRLKGHFSEKWLTRHGPLAQTSGEDPVHTGRRALREKAVKVVMELACVGRKKIRRKHGRQGLRQRLKRYDDVVKGVRMLCKLKK